MDYLLSACKLFYKYSASVGRHTKGCVSLNESHLTGYKYSNEFKKIVYEKYPDTKIKNMLEIGYLGIGYILDLLNDEKLYNFWIDEFCKDYSPLLYGTLMNLVKEYPNQELVTRLRQRKFL